MAKILDASVAVHWFLYPESDLESTAILDEVMQDAKNFAVPELFFFELAHTFHRVIASPQPLHIELLETILTIGIQRFTLSPELLTEMRHFQRQGITGYDAAYIGLAKLLNGQWLTFDKKAHQKIARHNLSRLLS
jgi:predicted nucleic acid-binding protein